MNPKYKIVPIHASKRKEVDSYSGGCQPGTSRETELDLPAQNESILAVMSELVGSQLKPDDVYTFDPNIYCDTKTPPGYRVVNDNTANGIFRVEHDRLENKRGRIPTAEEMAEFNADKITLFQVTYELIFSIRVVGLGEKDLAEFLGCVNHG
jgi:hypothetical protein